MDVRILLILGVVMLVGCTNTKSHNVEVYETSAAGHQWALLPAVHEDAEVQIALDTTVKYQRITGIGGAFTESTAYVLHQLSAEKRQEVLDAYFGEKGANYSLTRTHINSCDFSLNHYSYDTVPGDTHLKHFNINHDTLYLIPVIQQAQSVSKEGFKLIASPWTAPPWMKDNGDWNGGSLLPEYYATWANYFSKYLKSYEAEGINFWAVTVENEPLGNGANWESMHYSPEEMSHFVKHYLGPTLQADGWNTHILVYDQNRGPEMVEYAGQLLQDSALLPWIYGTAVHWYTGTQKWFPASLQYIHETAPQKHIVHTEGCVDAEVPHWREDDWYWQKEATDWGYDWAPEATRHNHPKYVPVYRYARDIIGCFNNYVEGWVDWNMVLDRNGGPNLAENWCVAPVIVDPEKDEVYYTPLYYVMKHFSAFIRPGAQRIEWAGSDESLLLTAVKNVDGSVVLVVLNPTDLSKTIEVSMANEQVVTKIDAKALQTIVFQINE